MIQNKLYSEMNYPERKIFLFFKWLSKINKKKKENDKI